MHQDRCSEPPARSVREELLDAVGEHATGRSRNAARVALVALLLGTAVLLIKVVAWLWTGSVALFSDAMESIVNVVASGAALVALRIAEKPPDENHPFGHAKAEYFSAVLEGVLIAAAAVAIGIEAFGKLLDPEPLTRVGAGLALSFVATAVNGSLAVYLTRNGRALRSPALEADGKHLWADVWTSGGVWVGVGAAWATGWWILDPILALVVAGNVVRTGWLVVVDSVGGLMDEALPPDEVQHVHNVVRAHLGETAIEVHDLRTRRSAAHTFIEFHLVVAGDMTVRDSHDLCDRLERELVDEVPGARIQIHVEPEREAQNLGRVVGPTHSPPDVRS